MTITDPATFATDARDIPSLADLPDDEKRRRAREMWEQSGGTLSGAELADRFGMSPKWGQNQRRAAEAAVKRAAAPPGGTAGTNGAARPGVNGAARPAPTVPAAPARKPAAARSAARRTGTPLPLLAVTVGAVALVTAVCAVVSYTHIAHLARTAGMGDLSWVLPLGIDGMVAAATASLIVDRQQGRAGHAVAWAGVVLGLAGSLTANVLAVDPELVSLRAVRWVLAGYPPVALAVSAHLAARILGDR